MGRLLAAVTLLLLLAAALAVGPTTQIPVITVPRIGLNFQADSEAAWEPVGNTNDGRWWAGPEETAGPVPADSSGRSCAEEGCAKTNEEITIDENYGYRVKAVRPVQCSSYTCP
eukprot:SAG31_NODE_2081_length_6493_cov_2.552393_3_plen_114_part_00